MLMGLFLLFDCAIFVEMATKNPLTRIKTFVFAAAGIFTSAAFVDPLTIAQRLACAAVGLILIAAFATLVVKTRQWKREAKAAQMPNASAT